MGLVWPKAAGHNEFFGPERCGDVRRRERRNRNAFPMAPSAAVRPIASPELSWTLLSGRPFAVAIYEAWRRVPQVSTGACEPTVRYPVARRTQARRRLC